MTNSEILWLLERVTDVIRQIDQDCQYGLVYAHWELREKVWRETSKKLSPERLIAYLMCQKLRTAGLSVDWELRYPTGSRKSCDLVFNMGNSTQLWLELKLAWKAWFDDGKPVFCNGHYLSYLRGTRDRTHSFRHDFEKLATADFHEGDNRVVCLIGFDWAMAPMDAEVTAVVERAKEDGNPWEAAKEMHLLDRTCDDFRINVWTWLLPSEGASAHSELPAEDQQWTNRIVAK
jgi:hypothetical protein